MKKQLLYRELGEYLKDRRKEVGVTQSEIAEGLGYTSPQFISNVERGLCLLPLGKTKKALRIIGADKEEYTEIYLRCMEIIVRKSLR